MADQTAPNDPRRCDRDQTAQEPHGDDVYHYSRHTPGDHFNNSLFNNDHHPYTVDDRPEYEHFGHASEQDLIDWYRVHEDPPHTLNDLGHTQDRGRSASVDSYADSTRTRKGGAALPSSGDHNSAAGQWTPHSEDRTGGKPYNRRRG